jgi:methyl-accepting chemotaxis protein
MGSDILRAIAEQGDISMEVPDFLQARQDEIGKISRGVRRILNDYKQIAARLQHLAEGDWTDEVQTKGPKDELNHDFVSMYKQVIRALREIKSSVEQVSTEANEVSNASQALADGAQKSAASLEQISASMHEISGQTKKNA